MARDLYSSLDGWDLVHDEQDARGREAVDTHGTRLGTVTDMVADTEAGRIVALVLDSGAEVDADRVELHDDRVIVQGGVSAAPHYGEGSHLRVRTVGGDTHAHGGTVHTHDGGDVVHTHGMGEPSGHSMSGTDAGFAAGAVTGAAHGMRRYDDDVDYFRTNHASSYGPSGRSYESVEPSYRYGYDVAGHDTYRGREWDDQLEADLSRDYEGHYGEGTWHDMKTAVKSGFQRARNAVTGGDDGRTSTPY